MSLDEMHSTTFLYNDSRATIGSDRVDGPISSTLSDNLVADLIEADVEIEKSTTRDNHALTDENAFDKDNRDDGIDKEAVIDVECAATHKQGMPRY